MARDDERPELSIPASALSRDQPRALQQVDRGLHLKAMAKA